MSAAQVEKRPASGARAVMTLLRERRHFAWIWGSQVFSQVGDWFSFVALLALVLDLTGSGLHVSIVFLATAIPSLLLAPIVGVVADRWDRRRVLIVADLVRALASAGYLCVRQSDQIIWIYVLLVISVVANCFFSPCINAAIPQFVERERLTLANSLISASGGVVAALSAWLGGVVATGLGRETCFIVDSVSFLISAIAIYKISVPFQGEREKADPATSAKVGGRFWRDVVDCWQYAKKQPTILSLLWLKAGAGCGGGVMALLSVVPVQVFHAGDYGVGVLYGSRGLGTILGALAAGSLASVSAKNRLHWAGGGLALAGLFSVLFGSAGTLYIAALFVGGAFLGNGLQWVLTSSLLQQNSSDEYLGRIFALDNFAMTFTASIAALGAGIALEKYPPIAVAWCVGGIIIATYLIWILAWQFCPPNRSKD